MPESHGVSDCDFVSERDPLFGCLQHFVIDCKLVRNTFRYSCIQPVYGYAEVFTIVDHLSIATCFFCQMFLFTHLCAGTCCHILLASYCEL